MVFYEESKIKKNIYDENILKTRRKNIDSLLPYDLIKFFYPYIEPWQLGKLSRLLPNHVYKYQILKLILSYYDTADSIRPYLALLNFIKRYEVQRLSYEILQNILAHTKENILLMRYNESAFDEIDLNTQEELKRPISYIYNFLQTALVIDSDYNIIVDFSFVDRLQVEMNNVVFYQPTQSQNNSRPAREQRLFRDNVLKAYNNQCAVTGQSIFIDDRVLLEAAHIIPYRDGGSFAVSNGIALSYEMHKMFDNGLFGFFYDENQNLKIKISYSNKITDKNHILANLHNRVVIVPNIEEKKPDPLAVEYNSKKYLLK